MGSYLTAAAELLDLSIQAEHYDDVLAAFMVICGHAEHVMAFRVPDEIEAVPRFLP